LEFHRWADRIFGAGAGIVQGILAVSIMLFVLTEFISMNEPVVLKSQLAVHVVPITEKMTLMVPKRIRHDFRQKIKVHKKMWDNNSQFL
jgi:uncharacterized membrane protein required for colicin V production